MRAVVEDHLLQRGAVVAQHARRSDRARRECAPTGRPAAGASSAWRRIASQRSMHARRIGAQHLGRRAGGGGAQHDAALEQVFDMAAQPLALGLALDAAREADARADRVIDEVAAGDGDVHREARPLLALAVVAHLHQHRRARRRPVVAAGAVLGAQEARAAGADIDERGIEIGHHPLEPAEEHALDQRRPVAPHDLQLDQAAARRPAPSGRPAAARGRSGGRCALIARGLQQRRPSRTAAGRRHCCRSRRGRRRSARRGPGWHSRRPCPAIRRCAT